MSNKYCSYCGAEMKTELVGAENERQVCCFGDCYKIPYGSRYNTETGKRQYVRKYTCTNWKNKVFGSEHDRFIKEEIIT